MSPPSVRFELLNKKVYVAGHTGMVGSAIVRRLGVEGCEILTPKRPDLDLRRGEQVDRWMAKAKPDAVFLAAGKVGGIYANSTYPADFIADNLAIALNVIRSAYETGAQKISAVERKLRLLILPGSLQKWWAIKDTSFSIPAALTVCRESASAPQPGKSQLITPVCGLWNPG
jgi:hypothetical protein